MTKSKQAKKQGSAVPQARHEAVVLATEAGRPQGPEVGPEWIASTGTLIEFRNINPAVVRYRDLHNETIDDMMVNLRSKWNCSYAMLVVRVMDANGSTSDQVNVIDGSHRHEALTRLLQDGVIDGAYKVQCTVYQYNTPPSILSALAGKTNLDNETFQKMTLPDKAYYLVILIRDILALRNPEQLNDSGLLWVVTRNDLLAAMAAGGSNSVQFASGDSVMDGLLNITRCWVSHYDVGMWLEHQRKPTRLRYASVWQVVSFINEQGSDYWVNFRATMNDVLMAAEIAGDGDGPEKGTYKQELRSKAGIFGYAASYPGVYNSSAYNRANLKQLPTKHRRPQIEFIVQHVACYFMLTGRSAPTKFTATLPHRITGDGAERLVYDLWLRAHELRHLYDETMAGTFWFPPSKCVWPGCSAKRDADIAACDMCEVETGAVYVCCLDCSKVNCLPGVWSHLTFQLQGGQGTKPMHVCPTCVVAFLVRTYANPVAPTRTAWPPVSSAIEKEDCIRCFIGYGCSVHETAQHWSKAPGQCLMNALPQNLQRWFKQEPKLLSAIFEHLSEKKYHHERRAQYLIARDVEFRIACGSHDLSLWDKLDPTNQNVPLHRPRGGLLPGLAAVPDAEPGMAAFQQKLMMYRDMQDAPEASSRRLEIENTSWEAFWTAAQADASHRHKGVYNLVVVDPMYNYDMDTLQFATFRAMLNYVTAPMALVLVFHTFLLVAQWGAELSKPSKNAKVYRK